MEGTTLAIGEGAQRGRGDVRPLGQQLERSDQRVAPEQALKRPGSPSSTGGVDA